MLICLAFLLFCGSAASVGILGNTVNILSNVIPLADPIINGLFNAFTNSKSQTSTKPRNLMLTLSNPVTNALSQFDSKKFPSQTEKISAMATEMRRLTRVEHQPILDALEPFGFKTQSFWITNQILILDALLSNELIQMFLPFTNVGTLSAIAAEAIAIIPPVINLPGTRPGDNEIQWNVQKINAPEVWNATCSACSGKPKNETNSEIIVGLIDTGCLATHETLKDNFRGFKDCTSNSTSGPYDDVGHGTHCSGICCGKRGIGVCKDCKFIMCKGCTPTGCAEGALKSCAQFVTCPGDPGPNKTCDGHAHVVSNSWGGDQNNPFFDGVIKSWDGMGIIPVFAIGNNGSKCNTANSPGDRPGVISVGCTKQDDSVSDFSSRGDSSNASPKPLLVAPGDPINSAFPTSTTSYQLMSGTSMSTPHVAGSIALLLIKGCSPKEAVERIKDTAFQDFTKTDVGQCKTVNNNGSLYPNFVVGFGRIDVGQACLSN